LSNSARSFADVIRNMSLVFRPSRARNRITYRAETRTATYTANSAGTSNPIARAKPAAGLSTRATAGIAKQRARTTRAITRRAGNRTYRAAVIRE
jgi:hypothetical protein